MNGVPSGADLHIHTHFSDGSYTPEDLVRAAQSHGFRAIAVTDHDTVDGTQAAMAATTTGLRVIPGVEFSAECGPQEVHLVGLFVDPHNSELRSALQLYRQRREKRIFTIMEKLAGLGVHVPPEEVFRCAGKGVPGRVHVAKALIGRGHVADVSSAFSRYIGDDRAAYVRKERPTMRVAMDLIRAAGGLPVLAHPGLTNRDDLLPELAREGLRGIEVYSPMHSAWHERKYLKAAKDFGLLVSGGSDCHGRNKDRVFIGTVRLPDDRLDALFDAANART
jgi:3',5'-nucleoside bisphosphate phosphatase